MCRSTMSSAVREMNSQAVIASPVSARARDSTAIAACKFGSASIAVTCSRGRGNSFSTAAVMMPRVPSAPQNRCRRS